MKFPEVYYLDDLQLCFSEYRATDTERFILNALLQGFGSLNQLGRKTKSKIKLLRDEYVEYIEISKGDYNKMISQVIGYTSGRGLSQGTKQDQPPPKQEQSAKWREISNDGKESPFDNETI